MLQIIHTIKKQYQYYILYMVGFGLFILLSGAFIPFYINEDKTEAAVGTATQSTISLSLSSNNIALNLLQPGTYDANNLESGVFGSASTTASVSTTNYTGYTLSIAATNNNGSGNANNYSKLIDSSNTDTSKNFFASIESAVSEADFSANTATAGNNYNGKWGYKPSYYNSSANSNYLPAPSTSGATIEQTTAPNTTAKDYTITLGARANINQSAGSYSNTFNIVATANPVTYSITYSDNSGDSTIANLPSVQASSLNAQSKLNTSTISLSSTIPTRTGYTFSKWCLGSVSNSGTTCTGTEYSASADFGIDQTINNSSITLYAKWTINTYTCTKRYRLQNADGTYPSSYTSDGSSQINHGSTCSYSKSVTNYQTQSTSQANMTGAVTLSLSLPRNTYTLTINRNTTYISSVSGAGTYRWGQSVSISATAASNSTFTSWSQTSGTASSFTSTTSASTTFTMPTSAATIYADGQGFLYMQDMTSSQMASLMPTNGSTTTLYDKRDNQAYTVAKLNDGDYWMTQNLNLAGGTTISCNTSDCVDYTIPTSQGWQSGGKLPTSSLTSFSISNYAYVYNSGSTTCSSSSACYSYYSWDAATLGSGRTIDSGTNAPFSICPKGWRLPSVASINQDFSQLASAYSVSGSNFTSKIGPGTIPNFVLSGAVYDANGFTGGVAQYWSATYAGVPQSVPAANNLYYNGRSTFYSDNYTGTQSGLAVRCIFDTHEYMQNFTLANCQSLASSASRTIYDIRDRKYYNVRYINGVCTMTQGLRFTGTTLSSTASNVSSNTTITWYDLLTDGAAQTSTCTYLGSGRTSACKKDSANGNYYNYYAATAKTISGSSNSTNASYDICPKNWHLPTQTNFSNITGYVSAYSPQYNGYYGAGNTGMFLASDGTDGYYWSATANGSEKRYALHYNSGSLSLVNDWYRDRGTQIRCVRTS